MNLATDPPSEVKIARMRRRVRWDAPPIRACGIDQTRLVLEGSPREPAPFSFLVLGDSGTGHYRGDSPQRRVAERLLPHREEVAFLLHTGDLVYLVGSSEQYPENFIEPYREWLVGGEDWRAISWRDMVFRQPFLPVPGNHDYYDLSPLLGLLSGLTLPVRSLLGRRFDLDVGWHGSFQGEAYARAFLDGLDEVPEPLLGDHLDRYYHAWEAGLRCLAYRPSRFTRLPNRHYGFRYAGVEFLALDSNTFNQPLRPPRGSGDGALRSALEAKRQRLGKRRQQLIGELLRAGLEDLEAATDTMEHLEQIEEEIRDLELQRSSPASRGSDPDQLRWLRERLIASWGDTSIRGRILFLHHAPYTTEATKWDQAQTLAVRLRLRRVLDAVAGAVGERCRGRPPVDLVLAGHAHCLEVLRSLETGHGDGGVPWVVCGGSGYSLRRQRREGAVLREGNGETGEPVAESRLFIGRSGHGSRLRRPYSAVRIDVAAGEGLRLSGTALLAEKAGGSWREVDVPLPLAPP